MFDFIIVRAWKHGAQVTRATAPTERLGRVQWHKHCAMIRAGLADRVTMEVWGSGEIINETYYTA